jgi:hypothetical protein
MRISEREYTFDDEKEEDEFINAYLLNNKDIFSKTQEEWLDKEYNRIFATYAYADMSSPQ